MQSALVSEKLSFKVDILLSSRRTGARQQWGGRRVLKLDDRLQRLAALLVRRGVGCPDARLHRAGTNQWFDAEVPPQEKGATDGRADF
jgi:hypothetical protein